MSIHARPMTAEELYLLPDDHMRHELVRGELTTMNPAGWNHGRIIVRLANRLGPFIENNRLGEAVSADTGFILSRNPDTVRAPDFAFVSKDRVAEHGMPKAFYPVAPDLAVEVNSPGDTKREIAEKIAEYFAAGSREVWIVNPDDSTVTIHRSTGEVLTLSENDTLDGGQVVPGFRCSVAELFATQ